MNLTSAVQIIDQQMELSVTSSIHGHDHGEGNNETMSGKGRGRNRSISEALEESTRLAKMMLHPYSKIVFYIPCTIELRTYDAMRTQPRFNTLRKMTLINGGHARQNDINEVHMAHGVTQRNDTRHHGIIGFKVSVAHMAHPHQI